MNLPFGGKFLPVIGDAVSDLGYGVAKGGFKRGFGIAAERGAEMQPYRTQRRDLQRKEDERLRLAALNAKYLVGDPELQQMVASGALEFGPAYQMWQQKRAEGAAPKPIEVNGQLVDPVSFDVLGDYRTPEEPDQPNLPTGYIPDPSVPGGMMPAPGSPDDLKRREADSKRSQSAQQADMTIDNTMSAVDRALQQTSGLTAGNVMGKSGAIPIVGQGAADLGATLDTIKANLGFEALQAMRESSPTGGALGQVAVQELTMLQATVASLDQSQSPEQLAANLALIKQRLQRLKTLRQQGGSETGGNTTSTGIPWSIEP